MHICNRMLTILGVTASMALTACTGETGDDGTVDPVLLSASANIPVEGGTIELDDGAWIEFPAGALNQATDVTLRRFDCDGLYQAASFASCRYAVEGPDGALASPYELHIPTRGPGCATQQTLDGLSCLWGGESQADGITTLANSFGEFTSWSDDAIIPTDACVMPNFAACGGELLGSWTMSAGCGTIAQLTNSSSTGPNPYANCDPLDYYVGAPFSVSGALAFDDLGYTVSSGFTIMKHELVTSDCLATIGENCHPDCTLADGICECLFLESEGDGAAGSDVWTTDGAGSVELGSVSHRYCVDGDTLTVEWGSAPDLYYTVYSRG